METLTRTELIEQTMHAIATCQSQPATYYSLYFLKGELVCNPRDKDPRRHGWCFVLTRIDITHGLTSRRWDELEAEFKKLLERNKSCPKQSKPLQPTKLSNCLPNLPDPKATVKDSSLHTETT